VGSALRKALSQRSRTPRAPQIPGPRLVPTHTPPPFPPQFMRKKQEQVLRQTLESERLARLAEQSRWANAAGDDGMCACVSVRTRPPPPPPPPPRPVKGLQSARRSVLPSVCGCVGVDQRPHRSVGPWAIAPPPLPRPPPPPAAW